MQLKIYRDTNLDEWFINHIQNIILKDLEEFQEKYSEWALSSIINLTININKYTPMLGSSYIELPPQIKRKKACINVRNNDDVCFAWAVVSALCPAKKNPQRIAKYPHYSTILSFNNILFPMTIKQVPRFEQQNDVSLNLYILNKKGKKFNVYPTYLTKDKRANHINLLLLENEYYDEDHNGSDNHSPRYHNVWIKNFL